MTSIRIARLLGSASSNSQPSVPDHQRALELFDFELYTWPTLITLTTCLIVLNLLQQQISLSFASPHAQRLIRSNATADVQRHPARSPPPPPPPRPTDPAFPYRLASAEPRGGGASQVSDPVRRADSADRAAAPEANRNPALLSSSSSSPSLRGYKRFPPSSTYEGP